MPVRCGEQVCLIIPPHTQPLLTMAASEVDVFAVSTMLACARNADCCDFMLSQQKPELNCHLTRCVLEQGEEMCVLHAVGSLWS